MGSRNWCLTCNNYKYEDIKNVMGCGFTYLLLGVETGDSGTPHLQGYVEFKSVKLFTVLKKQLPGWHLEPRRGNQKQAVTYCKKDGEWEECGTLKEQGMRKDLDTARSMAESGGMRQVTTDCTYVQIRVAQAYLTYNEEPRNWVPEVYWIYGATGTGKSRRAREICGDRDTHVKNKSHKWWDGYDGHECIIMDDYRKDWMPFADLLGLLDRYEYQVEMKGGMRQIRARIIIITCPEHPSVMYKFIGEDIKQLLRRLTEIIETTSTSEVGGNTKTPTDAADPACQ